MSFDTSVTRVPGSSICSASVYAGAVLSIAMPGQGVRQAGGEAPRLEEEPARSRGFLPWLPDSAGGQLEAAVDLLLGRVVHQLVEEAAHLAHVARRLGQAFLAGVELLEHDHRQVDVVLTRSGTWRRGRA